MKAKHWLLTGAGCIAGSIVLGVITMLWWMSRIGSFGVAPGRSQAQLDQKFVVALVAEGIIALLFFGGIIVLIVGFIKLAKTTGSSPSGATGS